MKNVLKRLFSLFTIVCVIASCVAITAAAEEVYVNPMSGTGNVTTTSAILTNGSWDDKWYARGLSNGELTTADGRYLVVKAAHTESGIRITTNYAICGLWRYVPASTFEAGNTYRLRATFRINSDGKTGFISNNKANFKLRLMYDGTNPVFESQRLIIDKCDEFVTHTQEFVMTEEMLDGHTKMYMDIDCPSSGSLFSDANFPTGRITMDFLEFVIEKADIYTVIGKTEPNSTLTVELKHKYEEQVYYTKDVTADENGRFETDIAFYHNIDDFYVCVKDGENTSVKSMNTFFETDGKKIVETDFFADVPTNGVYVNGFTVNGVASPFNKITLPETAKTVSVTAKSIDYEGDSTLIGVLYENGSAKEIACDVQSLIPGADGNYSICLGEGGDEIRFFLLDSISSMKLLSREYVIDTKGTTEKRYKANASVTTVTSDFNPVTATADITRDGGDGTATVVITKKDVVLSDITADTININVAAVVNSESNVTSVKKSTEKPDGETYKFPDGTYTAYVSGVKNTQDYSYTTPDTLLNAYSTLNGSNVDFDSFDACISDAKLKLDLSEYNSLGSNKKYAKDVFMKVKTEDISSVGQIQTLLDTSVSTVLLSSAPTVSLIEKYGTLLGFDSVLLEEFKTADEDVKTDTASLMKSNAHSLDSLTVELVKNRFTDGYVTAMINNAETYGMIKQFISDNYKNYISVNLNKLEDNDVNSGDVFKDMLDMIPFDSIKDIEDSYSDAVDDNTSSSGGGFGGGGVGGGGFGASGNIKTETMSAIVPAEAVIFEKTATFKDVNKDFWAYDYIENLVNLGVISKSDNFRPNDDITREEFVKMVVVAFYGSPSGGLATYTDATAGAWYYPYLAKAQEQQIISGMPDGSFGVGEKITRQDMAVIIDRIIGKDDTPNTFEFSDDDAISSYAREAVYNIYSTGVIGGFEDSTFRPQKNATRAECAKIISQASTLKNTH